METFNNKVCNLGGGSYPYENCNTCIEEPLKKTPIGCSRNQQKWEEFCSLSKEGKENCDLGCGNYEPKP